MHHAIDSPKGRQLYSRRIGTVEPVFADIRQNKRLTRLSHRGRAKVGTQWHLYCMMYNIEKLTKKGLRQLGKCKANSCKNAALQADWAQSSTKIRHTTRILHQPIFGQTYSNHRYGSARCAW